MITPSIYSTLTKTNPNRKASVKLKVSNQINYCASAMLHANKACCWCCCSRRWVARS